MTPAASPADQFAISSLYGKVYFIRSQERPSGTLPSLQHPYPHAPTRGKVCGRGHDEDASRITHRRAVSMAHGNRGHVVSGLQIVGRAFPIFRMSMSRAAGTWDEYARMEPGPADGEGSPGRSDPDWALATYAVDRRAGSTASTRRQRLHNGVATPVGRRPATVQRQLLSAGVRKASSRGPSWLCRGGGGQHSRQTASAIHGEDEYIGQMATTTETRMDTECDPRQGRTTRPLAHGMVVHGRHPPGGNAGD